VRLSFLTSRLFLALEVAGMGYSKSGESRTTMLAFPLSLLLRFELPSFGTGFLAYLAAGPVADFVTRLGRLGHAEPARIAGGHRRAGRAGRRLPLPAAPRWPWSSSTSTRGQRAS